MPFFQEMNVCHKKYEVNLKQLFVSLISLIFCSNVYSQIPNYSWSKHVGDTASDKVRASVVDDSGNIYSTGHFMNTVDFDPGSAVVKLTAFDSTDIFISKFNKDGQLVWVKQVGGVHMDEPHNITLDNNGNIIVVGSFRILADLDPGSGTKIVSTGGKDDFFILKLDNDGDFIFAHQFGSSHREYAFSVTCDNQNNILVTGIYSLTTDFDPGSGVSNLNPSNSSSDVYVLKLNNNGNFIWAKSFGGGTSHGWSIRTDDNNDVFVLGVFVDSIDTDPGLSNNYLHSNGQEDVFIVKLDKNGDHQWSYSIGGPDNDRGHNMVITDNNDVIIGGQFFGTVDLNPGSGVQNVVSKGFGDCFLMKITGNGDFQWTRHFGDTDTEAFVSLTYDEDLGILATGQFYGVLDIDPSTLNVHNVVSNGQEDIFIASYNPANGNLLWGVSIGGTHADYAHSIGADFEHNLYLSGTFIQTADFDPSTTTQSLTSNGFHDVFFLKLINPYLSVRSIDISSNFNLYPNPANDILNIDIVTPGNYIMTLLSMDGKTLLETRTENTSGFQISLPESIADGLYLMNIRSEDQIMTKKIQIKRH